MSLEFLSAVDSLFTRTGILSGPRVTRGLSVSRTQWFVILENSFSCSRHGLVRNLLLRHVGLGSDTETSLWLLSHSRWKDWIFSWPVVVSFFYSSVIWRCITWNGSFDIVWISDTFQSHLKLMIKHFILMAFYQLYSSSLFKNQPNLADKAPSHSVYWNVCWVEITAIMTKSKLSFTCPERPLLKGEDVMFV